MTLREQLEAVFDRHVEEKMGRHARLLDDLEALYPPTCPNCGKNPPTYCYHCWATTPTMQKVRSQKIWTPWCPHLTWVPPRGLIGGERPGYWGYGEDKQNIAGNWRICPICATSRPQEKA